VRKEKGKATQSESDDDEIPFSELREKVRAETEGSGTETDRPRQVKDTMITLLSEREADETAMFGEVITWSDDDNATAVLSLSELANSLKEPVSETLLTEVHSPCERPWIEAVGTKVAKDFGSLGVYFGTVLSVEYDSDDEKKAIPFYCVKYSDGDTEDLNEDEFGFARELRFQMDLDAEDERDERAVTSGTDEDESYRPSPKVMIMPSKPFCFVLHP
jgi:hypothetical protein